MVRGYDFYKSNKDLTLRQILIKFVGNILLLLFLLIIINYFNIGEKTESNDAKQTLPNTPTKITTNNFSVSNNTPENNSPKINTTTENETFLVTRVIDGDTIEIENGQRIRLIGIDTPETVNPNSPVECFGKEASNKTKDLLEGKYITIEKDVSDTDRYGRLLRYVYTDNIFVNDYLVKNGYATVSTYPPDVKYVQVFRISEQYAIDNNLGLWSECNYSF